jgi:DNA-directed RNA polymerase sigma subunit (sigma70/sigma32)
MSLIYEHAAKPTKPTRYSVGQEIPDHEFVKSWTNFIFKEALAHMDKGMGRYGVDVEDLIQLGMLGLSKVPANRRFSTVYVTNAIRRTMIRPWAVAQAQRKENNGIFSLSQPLQDDGGDLSDWNSTLIDDRARSEMDSVPARIDVERLRKALTPVENQVIDYLLEGHTLEEIRDKMATTSTTVGNIHRTALRRMYRTAKKESTRHMRNHGSSLQGRAKKKKAQQ